MATPVLPGRDHEVSIIEDLMDALNKLQYKDRGRVLQYLINRQDSQYDRKWAVEETPSQPRPF